MFTKVEISRQTSLENSGSYNKKIQNEKAVDIAAPKAPNFFTRKKFKTILT